MHPNEMLTLEKLTCIFTFTVCGMVGVKLILNPDLNVGRYKMYAFAVLYNHRHK